MTAARTAVRAVVRPLPRGAGARAAIVARADALGVRGWVRRDEGDEGALRLHAEGPAAAVDALVAFLRAGPAGAPAPAVELAPARVEGHEQFAIRGVPAGAFVVLARAGRTRGFELQLEVGGAMRAWALPKGPSLDPAAKRLALPLPDRVPADAAVEGRRGDERVIVWDRGVYEQGGRVPWPAALARGHAVFVLHGEKLRGGFALQRTGAGDRPPWLLVKRRDDHAQPGADVVAERPASVLSGRTLDELGA